MTTTDDPRKAAERGARALIFAKFVEALGDVEAVTSALDAFGVDPAVTDRAALDYAAGLRTDA